MTLEGTEFINAKPEVVINYLQNRHIKKINIHPSDLHIKNEGKYLKLGVGSSGEEYPLRSSFLKKLLKWYSFPAVSAEKLSGETIASICNDFLLQINSEFVTVTIEDENALTITSPHYNEIPDLTIISRIEPLGLHTISRNDYMMRITTQQKYKIEPVPGDECGIGLSVTNSETGFGALKIDHFILRYICTNGAISRVDEESGRWIHYGKKDGELSRFLEEEVKKAVANCDKLKHKFQELIKTKPGGDEEIVNRLRKILGKKAVVINNNTTMYDLFNLVTEKAKEYDLSKRMFLERIAGEMMN